MSGFWRIVRLVVINLVVVIVLLEGGLRLLWPILPPSLHPPVNYVLTDEPFAVAGSVEHLQTDGRHHYVLRPDIEDGVLQISPSVRVPFETNGLWGGDIGFRNRPPFYEINAIAVGDSFTFCMVPNADCWVRQFETQTGLGTVNMGQPGTASVSHASMVQTFGPPIEPDLVLWQWFGNDFFEDYVFAVVRGEIDAEAQSTVLRPDEAATARPPRPLDPLRENSVAFAAFDYTFGDKLAYFDAYQQLFTAGGFISAGDTQLGVGQQYLQLALDVSREETAAGIPYTATSLAETDALVSGWGGELVVILTPTKELVYAEATTAALGPEVVDIHRANYDAMLAICDELALACFDPLPGLRALAAEGAVSYYADDMHLNEAGNGHLTDLLVRWLGEMGLVG